MATVNNAILGAKNSRPHIIIGSIDHIAWTLSNDRSIHPKADYIVRNHFPFLMSKRCAKRRFSARNGVNFVIRQYETDFGNYLQHVHCGWLKFDDSIVKKALVN
jgi:hypothetical protein